MVAPVLPPEIVELIVQHFTECPWLDYQSLRNCALISRTWVVPSQRALFRAHYLYDETNHLVVPFLLHLRRYPHLQNFIQRMSICVRTLHYKTRHAYLSSLAFLFPLLPRLTYLQITFHKPRAWDTHDRQFIEAFTAFFHTSESLTDLVISNLQNEADFQQMFLYLEGTNVKRVSLYSTLYQPDGSLPVDSSASTLSVVHLPAIEHLYVNYYLHLHSALNFWLCRQSVMFPNLKHVEVVVGDVCDMGRLFRDILRPAALRLESFRLELKEYDYDLPSDTSLFEGLHYGHFKLRIPDIGTGYRRTRSLINWLSSMFRYLADSGSVIHFTELTFTFTHLDYLEAVPALEWRTIGDYLKAVSAEWGTLDEVLSHSAFSGVRRVHFEDGSYKKSLITDQAYPELTCVIRRTFPCLASQGVLCFS